MSTLKGASNARVMLNNNFFDNRDGLSPKYVIIHGTAGGTSAEAIASYFASTVGTSNPVSSHYVVGIDGEVVQCVSELDGAYANGALTSGHATYWNESVNPNNITISIECCKPATDNSSALTSAQQAALFALVKDICNRWGIPKQNATAAGGITGHFSIDPVNRSNCPGPLAWKALFSYLSSASTVTTVTTSTSTSTAIVEDDIMIDLDTPGVSQFWTASANGAWHCIAKNHDFLMLGNIRSFYVRYGNKGLCGVTYLGLPLTAMFAIKSGIYAQLFERGLVIDDHNRIIDSPVGLESTENCYLGHVDNGTGLTLISQPVAAALQAQITALKAQLATTVAGTDAALITSLQSQIKTLTNVIAVKNANAVNAIALLQK